MPRPARVRPPKVLVPGAHVVVAFEQMGPDGAALGRVGGRVLAVPYAAPGEEATVEILETGRGSARGRVVALRRPGEGVVAPLCPHFGQCGGCQWQHLDYVTQLEQKALLVGQALARPSLRTVEMEPAIGWGPPWGFRTRLEATAGPPDGAPVLGFYAWGETRVIDAQTCPVQHPANVALLGAVRDGWAALADRPRCRGVIGRVGAATGEVLLGLTVTEPLDAAARAAVVRAFLDRVPGLVGILEVGVPRRGPVPAGRRPSLLWGRACVREEVAGVRYRVPLLAEFPTNARALPGVIELVLTALDASGSDTVIEIGAGIGAYTLHLALAASRAVGVTSGALVDAARANAHDNRIENCSFYTRDAARAVQKASRAAPVRLAFLRPDGTGLGPSVVPALHRAGVERIVYLGRSLRCLGDDAGALQAAGYRIVRARPVDTSPHTSRVNVLLVAEAGSPPG